MSVADSTDTVCLQPHLLTKVSLIRLLEQKCMNIRHLSVMSKESLVELYQRIVLPLPQRKYRQNHRGRLLTKLRNERESRKREDVKSCTTISYGFSDKNLPRVTISGFGDRLKPPPDTVNFEKKKIKLSGSSSKSNELDHIQIKKRKNDDVNGLGDERSSSNKTQETSSALCSSGQNSKSSHKVILKRSHCASTKQSDAPDREPKKKKERKSITWP